MYLQVPISSIIIGEGVAGGVLGLAVANDVWMLQNSIYSVISLEGFSSILLKDAIKAKEASDMMKIIPEDLLTFSLIDKIIKEPLKGVHLDYDEMGKILKENIGFKLSEHSYSKSKIWNKNVTKSFEGMVNTRTII